MKPKMKNVAGVVLIAAVVVLSTILVTFCKLDAEDQFYPTDDPVYMAPTPISQNMMPAPHKPLELVPIITVVPDPTASPSPEPTAEPTAPPTPNPTPYVAAAIPNPWKSLGTYKLTAYCPCQDCSGGYRRATASGATATAGRTIAVDPKVIPYGSKILIDGHVYVAEDCGGGVKGNIIDIFFDTHAEVNKFGRKFTTVYIYRP